MKEDTAYWFLKSVSNEDTNYKSNDGYDDEIETKYVYDSDVANHKNIKPGDIAAIADKERVLGIAKISRIITSTKTKERRRCPFCEHKNTTYDIRKTKTPKYRCNKGHVFEAPETEIAEVMSFEAIYSDSFRFPTMAVTVEKIRPYFQNNYNQNMSMQRLSSIFFFKYFSEEIAAIENLIIYPSAEEADNIASDVDPESYRPSTADEREKIFAEIKRRRGQQKFRDALRKAYGDQCMITGCKVLEVLEAAHINPYRGEKDNHVANGLLLRSDIHTLYDLDLIGINPENFTISLSRQISEKSNDYKVLDGKKLLSNLKASIEALKMRWEKFKQ